MICMWPVILTFNHLSVWWVPLEAQMLTDLWDLQDRNDTTPEDLLLIKGTETPRIPSCRKWEALFYQDTSAFSYQGQHSHVLPCCIPVYQQPHPGWACPSMQQSQCYFSMWVHMPCVCDCHHHLWWRCQAGTYSLVIHLPHWQILMHPPCHHWPPPHPQKGLWRFHLMLLPSVQIPHVC